MQNGGQPQDLLGLNSYAKCQEPIVNIYQFMGVYVGKNLRESLSLEHVMWANTVLATGKILGLVILNGNETRMSMNSRQPKTKFGIIDRI